MVNKASSKNVIKIYLKKIFIGVCKYKKENILNKK